MAPTSKRGCGPWLSGRAANPFGLHDQLPSTRSGDVVDEAIPAAEPSSRVNRLCRFSGQSRRPGSQHGRRSHARPGGGTSAEMLINCLPAAAETAGRHHGGTQLVVSIYLTVAGDVSDVIDTIRRLATGNGSSPAAASNNPGGDPDGHPSVDPPAQPPAGGAATVAEDPWTEELARALWVLLSPNVQQIYRRVAQGNGHTQRRRFQRRLLPYRIPEEVVAYAPRDEDEHDERSWIHAALSMRPQPNRRGYEAVPIRVEVHKRVQLTPACCCRSGCWRQHIGRRHACAVG